MEKYVGACGCICSDCRVFKISCEGCYSIKGKAVWLHEVGLDICDFYECSVIEKGLKHCGECNEIPCNKFWTNKNPKWTDDKHKTLVLERTAMLKKMAKI